jgi:hypothetical protein
MKVCGVVQPFFQTIIVGVVPPGVTDEDVVVPEQWHVCILSRFAFCSWGFFAHRAI